MSKIQVTQPTSSGHTRFEAWGSDIAHSRYIKLDARRVLNQGNDEAQIELTIVQTPVRGKRATTIVGGMVLSPDEARKLALALCPELRSPEEP